MLFSLEEIQSSADLKPAGVNRHEIRVQLLPQQLIWCYPGKADKG
jgi:hypothetical protein